jgi:hypothetical protein
MKQKQKLDALLSQHKPDRPLYKLIRQDLDLLSWINEQVPESDNLPEQIYCIMNNLNPICKNGKRKAFKDSWCGYQMCGRTTCKCWKDNQSNKLSIAKNAMSEDEWNDVINKRKITNLEKYGTEFAVQNEEIKAKVAAANIEKYGVKTTLLEPITMAKIKESLIENHGVDSPMKSEEIKQKAMDTCLERYGHVVYWTITRKSWSEK